MKKEELKKLEAKLQEQGYKKYTTRLSSKESYGWFKSWKDRNDEPLYTIEWRVWDWSKYDNRIKTYGVDTLILDGGSKHRIDLEITSPQFDITNCEEIAYKLHNMLHQFIEKYGND